MLEPVGHPTHGALSTQGSAVPRGDPGRETDVARRDEAHHHPGQGLQRPPSQPIFRLASHLHQRMIETRRAFQVYPPWQPVIPKSVSTDLRQAGGHASLLSVNQRAEL